MILDDLESVLGPAPEATRSLINNLLQAAPPLHILATTRERVGGVTEGEAVVEVDALDDEAALHLFLDRSPRAEPVLAHVEVDAGAGTIRLGEALRELLAELDGYPLAIVTAAPHLRDSSVPDLLARIREEGLEVFDDPTIHDPIERTRARSLAVNLHLSAGKLAARGRTSALHLFAILSLFPAGLMKRVFPDIVPSGWEHDLQQLREYSLVQHAPEDDRYYLLGPVRRFASQYLDEEGRTRALERAGPVFAAMVRELNARWPELTATSAAVWLARDEANFVAVIDLCRGIPAERPAEPTPSLTIGDLLIALYQPLNQLDAAERLGRRLVSDTSWSADPAGLALVRSQCGDLARRRDQLDPAERHYQAAEDLFRRIGDDLGLANTLRARGDLARRRAQLDPADQHYQAAEDLFRRIGDDLGLANALQAQEDSKKQRGDRESAMASYREALALYEGTGAVLGRSNVLAEISELLVWVDHKAKHLRRSSWRLIWLGVVGMTMPSSYALVCSPSWESIPKRSEHGRHRGHSRESPGRVGVVGEVPVRRARVSSGSASGPARAAAPG